MKMFVQTNLSLFVLVLVLFFGISSAEAGPCRNNNWQPTFVHDLENEDGPWYVTSGGQFIKLRIVNNRDWVPHACELINRSGVRNRRGYTTCQQYTRIQCGCGRGVSMRNSTCASFLRFHNRRQPTEAYRTSNQSNNRSGGLNLLGVRP